MTKPVYFKGLILLLFFLPFTGLSQSLDHVLGEVLFQLKENAAIEDFSNSIRLQQPQLAEAYKITTVSVPFRILKLSFDQNTFNELEVLKSIQQNPFIENCQFNYLTQTRAEPDDQYFWFQWHLKNIGQGGGTAGVDVDATIAWEQTTGGISFTGDTVVICIIDESFDYLHEDLYENIWINDQEIPNDSVDNDGNGYVDDYLGWNVVDESDNIQNTGTNDWHGTAVAGIAGAVGNNEIGVSGIAWNLKLMLVSRGYSTADAIAAYSYPFINRKKYNQTFGQKGAFVVATSTSWGIDFGTPGDAPLWCAIYDSLGTVGILNAAATTNSNNDVDQVGDLPTTCTSAFLITTTSVDIDDVKMTNAGYGVQSIDLGAFGQNIYTTFNGNTYSVTSGTSAAAPQVAGSIGLLHTAPCPGFASLAKSNPQLAALTLKSYILNGVEPNPSLQGITLTGGRLNTNNSLNLLMDDCDFSGCFVPNGITINTISTTSVQISWLVEISTNNVNVRYRKAGTSSWTSLSNIQSPVVLNNLESCKHYEFQLQSECDNATSSYTASFNFQTDGCCSPPEHLDFTPGSNWVYVSWDEITAAEEYLLFYRELGTPIWNQLQVVQNQYAFGNLEECKPYEFKVRTICSSTQSIDSDVFNFTTSGCGACHEMDYCNSAGVIESFSWIDQVSISDLNNESGPAVLGYSDFTNVSANLIAGYVHEIEVSTDFSFAQLPAIFSIWIDFNQNGIFEAIELVHESQTPGVGTNTIIFIPPDALIGSTRMRISFMEENFGPCGISNLVGEVEDYCVNISEPEECLPPVNLNYTVAGNAAHLTWIGNLLINEYILSYREKGTMDWIEEHTLANNFMLSNLEYCTTYEFFLTSICNGETSISSPNFSFTTHGCSTCLDEMYCAITPCIVDFEWIEVVSLNDLNHTSGVSGGYMHFQNVVANLMTGENYELSLTPGFANDFFEEYFKVWIDYNQDGEFDEVDELIFAGISENGETLSPDITIPNDALIGSTRMRVSMKYNSPLSGACESGFFGEIEEYCVNIYQTGSTNCLVPADITFEEIDSNTILVDWEASSNAIAYKLRYRPLNLPSITWQVLNTSNNFAYLDHLEPCVDYEMNLQTICSDGMSNTSQNYFFQVCSVVNTDELSSDANKIHVYPNPFSQVVMLEFESESRLDLDARIYSIQGQLLKSIHINTTSGLQVVPIHLNELSSGIFLLQLFNDKQLISTTKLIHQAP